MRTTATTAIARSTARARTRSYVLCHAETGEIRQVGSSCLSLFLGVTLRGLWILEMFTAAELDEWRLPSDTDEHGPAGPREAITAHVPTVLRLALVVSDHGRRFVSRRAVAEGSSLRATADDIVDVLLPRPHAPADHRRWIAEVKAEASQVLQDQIDALRAHADTLDGDYGLNMRTLLAGDAVTLCSLPLLVSLVGSRYRAQEKAAARAAIAPGYIGKVGEKVTVDATVTAVRSVPNPWGVSELVLFRTSCGHVLKWFTQSSPDIAVGDSGHHCCEGQGARTVSGRRPDERCSPENRLAVGRGNGEVPGRCMSVASALSGPRRGGRRNNGRDATCLAGARC
ncbi:hypothetical protein [Rhodococcus zopfii]|uniref:hypothetical protein n=1 Tax=Rhodococcus zopfii TaxID=43772 RepID=UPI000934CD74|nr:hypothetical protein [Rhodococcus zopfii]